MWSVLITILGTVLEIAKEYLTWQVALTKLQTRKLSYDIDTQQRAIGRQLLTRIDAAKSAGDLASVSLLLDDAAQNALYVANVRSAIPLLSGPDLGVSGGIPAVAASGSEPDNGVKPTQSATIVLGPVATKPAVKAIPTAPFAVTGIATVFGLNYDGSVDTADNGLGAFGDKTANKVLIGCSIPIPVFDGTIGKDHTDDIKARRYTVDILSHVTGKHLTGVWIVDLGPAAWTHNAIDLTYATAQLLGHHDNGIVTYWITGPNGIVEIHGWLFDKGQAA